MSASTSQSSVLYGPSIPQPQNPGDIVGLVLQNTESATLPQQFVTFGQVFQEGQVQPGSNLIAVINGQDVPVQIDAKTAYPDGSVAMATLTLQQPALAANSSTGVMLAIASGTPNASVINIANAVTANNYNLAVNLNITAAAGGTPGSYTLNAGQLLQQALGNGTATYLMKGPDATEVQFQTDVTGSLRMVFNVTAYADGTFRTNVQFNNDLAMQANGGAVTYSAAITQNGQTVFSQSSLTQYQYQDWNQVVYTGSAAPQVNIQHDTAYLEKTGAIQNYDLSTGVAATLVSGEASQMAAAGWGTPLAINGVTQDMPMTGGRPDIGPTTQANTLWLMTQSQTAASYALGQASTAGAVPWNFYDPTAGTWVNTANNPNIWTEEAVGTSLTQPVDQAGSGWLLDTAHQPDLSYDAYLLTGSRHYLDELNAQASWAITWQWTGTRDYAWPGTGQTNDNLFFGQVRESAWSLREVDEAAYANPTGSAAKAYFTQVMNDNWQWLVDQLPSWTTLEGQAHGYVPGVYPNGFVAPWQQDYFVSTAVQAAEMGNQNAVTYLKWATNFIAGRFLNAANGFNPRDGISYDIAAYPSSSSGNQLSAANGAWTVLPGYQTWAEIGQATVAAGTSNGTGWSWSAGDYGELALESLAGIITVTGSPEAMQAYAWLAGSGAPYISQASQQSGPAFNIVPRLPDGNLLTGANVYTFNSTAPGTDAGAGTDDQLIVEEGNAPVTIQGGNGGINILATFGTGNDSLVGGNHGNYIFGGPGNDTIVGGGGTEYLQAGAGATTFVLSTANQATDTVASFKVGTDQLDIVDGTGQPLTATQIQQIISSATLDSSGDSVLTISAGHTVTLSGIGTSQLTPALFNEVAVTPGTTTTGTTPSDPPPASNILTVGAGQEYSSLSAAAAVVQNGDTIEVQAGTYTNDFATINANVTIEGVGGMATFVATEAPPNDKGILDVNGNVTIDNLALTGAAIPASLGGNGAGIRYEGGNLTLNNDYIYANQDGLLANPDPSGSITINNTEFADNGSGTGYTHNLYVNEVGTLTVDNSYFTGAVVGHEIKSRADNTIIENSRIQDGPTGTASYVIDLPNGGNATITNNLIEKGPNAQNPIMISAGEEGSVYANSSLTVSGNTILNDLSSPSSMGVVNDTGVTATIANNQIYGLTAAQIVSGPATLSNNTFLTTEPALNTAAPWSTTGSGSSGTGTTGTGTSGTGTTGTGQPATLTTSGNVIDGGATMLTVTDEAGDNTVIGGAGGLTFSTTASGDTIATAAGASDSITLGASSTVDSAGNDTIIAAAGNNTIFASGTDQITTDTNASDSVIVSGNSLVDSAGTDSIFGGVGNDTVTATGAATIEGGTGTNQYTLDGHDVLGSTGTDTVSIGNGGNATVTATGPSISLNVAGGAAQFAETGGGVNDTATVSGGTATITGGAGQGGLAFTTGSQGGAALTLGSGNDTVQSFGADTINAGAGSLSLTSGANTPTIQGGSGNVSITGGAGGAVFMGGSGSASIQGGTGALNVTAGSGNITLVGGGGNDTFTAGSGNAVVSEGNSVDTIEFGSGNTTINAGGTYEYYQFVAGHGGGTDVINNFHWGYGVLEYQGFSGSAVQNFSETGNVLQIGLTDGTKVLISSGVVAH